VSNKNEIETDILIIGGGMAGCFAAIKAKEQGMKVVMVDKGYAGNSGQTPWARAFCLFDPERGHKMDTWINQVNINGEYINNREWTEIAFKDSFARYQDLVSWGVEFIKEDGELVRSSSPQGDIEAVHMEPRKFAMIIRKQAIKSGVEVMDRIMVTDLLNRDGKVVGAIGIAADSYDLYVFRAKATVMCAGASSFKLTGWPLASLTSDGGAMAYRAGAEITGKEFISTQSTNADNPSPSGLNALLARHGTPARRRLVNSVGDELRGQFLGMEFEAHAGRAPIFLESPDGKIPRVGGASAGMSVLTAEGIWPVNTKCATSLTGLYAGGDSCGKMQVGAVYPGVGMALGFSPRWVTQVLQNTMAPYFILYIKQEERMQAALTIIEFLRDHLIPKLTAKDPHELRLAHETKSMVLNAEMMLRASLFRTESRGCHYREDYPHRDDPDWLAWVLLKEEEGKMKAFKKPIPEEWWPDLSKSYEERYPARFPGE